MVEEPERKLGPYTLVSKIGRGAFGVVWMAEKRSSIATTRFALKLPRDEDIDLDAFKQEATIWLQASGHSNVVPMIEADIYDEQVVIVSEYVTDGSLAKWIDQHGGRAPSIESACEMIEGVLSGLAHLHGRNIIHRDLKPDNILLQHETPRLADFGIARLLKSGSYSTNISGTLAYMAPEAFDGKRNEQTDVWSAGVIFYQLLAGRLPYDKPDMASFVGAIMRDDPPPLPETVPEVLRIIVMNALQREPSKRYASAKEMRQDLREAEHKLWKEEQRPAIVEPEVPPPARIPQPTIPYPQPAVTQVLDPPTTPGPIGPPAVPANKESRKSPSPLLIAIIVGVLLLGAVFAVGMYLLVRPSTTKQPAVADGPKPASTPANVKQSPRLGEFKMTLNGHSDQVWSVAFSPDGKTLASGSYDQTIILWDVKSGSFKQTLRGHTSTVWCVAFSPDGKTLASGSYDETIKLWDVQTGRLTRTLTGHDGWVCSVAFSPDGSTLVSGSQDNTIKLWDVQTGTMKQTLTSHTNTVESVAFSPDGKTIASGSLDNTAKLWDAQTGALNQTLSGHTDYLWSVAFSPDGTTLATGSKDDSIKLWYVKTGALKQTLTGHSDFVRAARFSPGGKLLASSADDNTVRLWDVETGTLMNTLTGHKDNVMSVAFSPDGMILASGSYDKTIKLWQVE